ncbi:SAM-dependent methyltransferase [Terracoccus luteus]|uniref:SAM-dependent MidA family methyltransferase n=1 Tax=Terracoccus luteus TaxID=53356 RepID=A0A839PTZ0_9MICO|nr:SAM-dependent methyltransferase [Terracoccus luteus]MBB2986224.1 SAM-dependent MidA family methyltransferase [Terracoccus luteus]MCP2172186.1 SAM-dependent MidA family methyltransferase [Terracoccus luteus]
MGAADDDDERDGTRAVPDAVPWRRAWHDALYASGSGFYRSGDGPAAHFATAANGPAGAALAEALLALWHRSHPRPPTVVVDVGAGHGELAAHLAALLDRAGDGGASATTRVVAVDVTARPAALPDRVEWLVSPGGAALPHALDEALDEAFVGALVVAHEWLDVVPCTVAEVGTDGALHELLVDPASGIETLGDALVGDDLSWCERYWRATEPGDRVEVGRSRDEAWSGLLGRVRSGLVVAVDYGHTTGTRPPAGTLTGYAGGRQVVPVPDGACDVTAHVAVDSLEADERVRQRDVLDALGLTGATPAHDLARADPLAYLSALQRSSALTALRDREGYGAFWWVVRRVRPADVP